MLPESKRRRVEWVRKEIMPGNLQSSGLVCVLDTREKLMGRVDATNDVVVLDTILS
jgi:hypothetical protein